MFSKNKISMYGLVCVISEIVSMVSPALNSRQKKVACIASNIALEMNLPGEDIQNIIIASMLHNIGTLNIETHTDEISRHALKGYNLLKNFEPFIKIAELIKYHHTDFGLSYHERPIGSYIIHLAEKTVDLFDKHRENLKQFPMRYNLWNIYRTKSGKHNFPKKLLIWRLCKTLNS